MATKKQLTLVAIYKFKSNGQENGTRCYLVRNSEGKEYQVWTHTNGLPAHCDCDGFVKSHGKRKCYHIRFAEAREAACKAVAQVAEVAETVAKQPAPACTSKTLVETGVRAVSMDWLLGRRGGTFAGRVA